jgi:hypothetical protein
MKVPGKMRVGGGRFHPPPVSLSSWLLRGGRGQCCSIVRFQGDVSGVKRYVIQCYAVPRTEEYWALALQLEYSCSIKELEPDKI